MQERDNKKMKYAVLLCDGMADLPREDIGGTPMSVAHKPNMDKLAKVSRVGLVKTSRTILSPAVTLRIFPYSVMILQYIIREEVL